VKNKSEALEAFKAWPREWQELCAEFTLVTVGQLVQAEKVLPSIGDPFPYDRTRAVRKQRAAAKRPILHFMRYTAYELGEVYSFLSSGCRPLETARLMDKKHPKQRTIEAWEKMVHRVKKHGLEKMLENAIDMEVQ
jgi:hypothetical protein